MKFLACCVFHRVSRKKRRFDWKRESEQTDEGTAPKKTLLE